MTPTQQAASLALAQVNLILAETQQQANAHGRHGDALRAVRKRVQEMNTEIERLVAASEAEAVVISTKASQLESEVQKFIKLNEELAP